MKRVSLCAYIYVYLNMKSNTALLDAISSQSFRVIHAAFQLSFHLPFLSTFKAKYKICKP